MSKQTKKRETTDVFASEAQAYWDAGYSVISIEPNFKKPSSAILKWSGYCDNLPKPETREEWIQRFGSHGIGLLLGREITDGYRLAAVDVDDDALVRVTNTIIGDAICSKVGKKGETFFVRLPGDKKLKSTNIKDSNGQAKIDFLASGKMTVIPPTIHPDTRKPYVWLGKPLLDVEFDDLPVFDRSKMDLLSFVVGSEHIPTLMSGQGTHDAGLVLSAQLVGMGLTDNQITEIFEALLPENYKGDSLEELPGWLDSARAKGFDQRASLPLDDAIAHIIEDELKPIVYVLGDGFLQYSEGYWQAVSDSQIGRLAKEQLNRWIEQKRQVQPILQNVRKCLQLNVERESFGDYSPRICLLNGTLNVQTGELEQFRGRVSHNFLCGFCEQ